MHSGFASLRGECPMDLGAEPRAAELSQATQNDLRRIVGLWSELLARYGGPFLVGDWSIADAFFTPVATRFRTYGVKLSDYGDAGAAGPTPSGCWRRRSSRPGKPTLMTGRLAILLRAVNVGGTGKLAMADLKTVLAALGCAEPQTLGAAGSAIAATAAQPAALEAELATALGRPPRLVDRGVGARPCRTGRRPRRQPLRKHGG